MIVVLLVYKMEDRWKYWTISDSPGWTERYKLGPVHFILKCTECGYTIDDIHPDSLDKAEEKMGIHRIEENASKHKKVLDKTIEIRNQLISQQGINGDGI